MSEQGAATFKNTVEIGAAHEQTVLPDFSTAKRFVVNGLPISSIRGINEWGATVTASIYRTLIPDEALLQYNIDPKTLTMSKATNWSNSSAARDKLGGGQGLAPGRSAGPLLYLQLADNNESPIVCLLFVVNDPTAPRFDVDRDWRTGELTKFGTQSRIIEAEVAAMQAGLAPGQVRRGLKLTRKLMPLFEIFVSRLGHQMFFMEPLAYHNALLFERYGCAYSQGRAKMEWINREFAPGGTLYHRLDGATPFAITAQNAPFVGEVGPSTMAC